MECLKKQGCLLCRHVRYLLPVNQACGGHEFYPAIEELRESSVLHKAHGGELVRFAGT